MKHRKITIALAATAVMMCTPALFADRPDTSKLAAGVKLGANHHLSLQGAYLNGDTGIGSYLCAWEWNTGSGVANANTQGPSARGLLAAYEATGTQKFLAGAQCAANQAASRYDADSTERPFSEDVILLAEIADAMHAPVYAQRAAKYHARTRAQFPTGAALADYYIDDRLSLSGWDLASQIEAALAVNQDDYAQAIALRLIQRRADWEGVLYGGWDYTIFSQASLTGVLADLDGKTIKNYRDEILGNTLSAQGTDGSWEGDYQETAFALMGLEGSPQTLQVRRAIAGGTKYLLLNQDPSGGWIYPVYGEYGEIDGEVLSALSPLIQNQGYDADRSDDFRDSHPGDHSDSHRHAAPHRGKDGGR
jgi:hypothetical protein